jgi:hypothetical protein
VYKVQTFIFSSAAAVRLTPSEMALIELFVRADPLIYAIHSREYLAAHERHIEQKDVAALRALLLDQFSSTQSQ